MFSVAAEDFGFAAIFNYSAFSLNIFEICFSRGKTEWSEIRHSLTDGRRGFQKHLKDTWEKKKTLLSDLSYKEETLSNSCGLLVTLIPVHGKLLPLEFQLLGICTDVNLGQCAHKLALISCLSSKNRNILCFLQIT